jgi:hypothetical protein
LCERSAAIVPEAKKKRKTTHVVEQLTTQTVLNKAKYLQHLVISNRTPKQSKDSDQEKQKQSV